MSRQFFRKATQLLEAKANPPCIGETEAIAKRKRGRPKLPEELLKAPRRSHGRTKNRPLEADMEPIVAQRRSHRGMVLQWMAMRAAEQNITNTEIASRLGVCTRTLSNAISKAGREGWLIFEDANEKIEHEIVPKALQNLNQLLEDGDRTATIEALKGTAFPVYRESKGAGEGSQTVLALKIETTEPLRVDQVTGNVVGRAKELPSEA